MTERASRILRDLMDTNWEMRNDQYPQIVIKSLLTQYWSLREELIEEMGKDAFNDFMNTGRRMFASPGDTVQDEAEVYSL